MPNTLDEFGPASKLTAAAAGNTDQIAFLKPEFQ